MFDICTMWDIYRTQLPLITALFPERAVDLANALLLICEEEGNLPIGYRMAKGADRFSRQGSALAQTFLADLCELGTTDVDWDWALCHMDGDLRRAYGEEYLLRGVAHPVTHTLDLAFGYHCTAKVAHYIGDHALAQQCEELAEQWVNAFDPETGLLVDSTYYEGGRWNYSFRITHDMRARIELAGGEERFTGLLDTFFGYGAEPVRPARGPAQSGGTRRRVRAEPIRGSEQRAGHGGPLGLPLRRAPRPDGRDRARRGEQPVRDRSRRSARQRRLRRAQLLVRVGVAGTVPHRRAEPVPDQRAVVRPVPARPARRRAGHRRPRVRRADPGGPVQYVQSVRFNSTPLERTWIPARDLYRGGKLEIVLGPEPSDWGRADRPPSISDQSTPPEPDVEPPPPPLAG